jgi:glycosyltransferase involved in cell wall biosynthesis
MKDNNEPTAGRAVTVLVASHGRLSLLESAVGSALAQDYPNFEVLVIDDGSDRETQSWLAEARDRNQRLRVLFQGHAGVGAARARGVREALGELICILDSDDMLAPHALRKLTGLLTPDKVLVHTGIREIRPNGEVVVRSYRSFPSARAMLWVTLLSPRVPFKHSGTLFRRNTAIELGSYDSSLPCKVDIDLYLKFLAAGHLPVLIPEPLVDFRMHKDSISRNRALGIRVWFILIDRYCPANTLIRLGIKGARAASEIFKRIYMDVAAYRHLI